MQLQARSIVASVNSRPFAGPSQLLLRMAKRVKLEGDQDDQEIYLPMIPRNRAFLATSQVDFLESS